MHSYSKLMPTTAESLTSTRSCTWREVAPHMWCVTKQDLQNLKKELKKAIKEGRLKPDDEDSAHYHSEYDDVYFEKREKWDPSVYKVMNDFIKPGLHQLEHSSSWALERHPEGLQCDIFATHAWKEGIFEFIDSASGCFRGQSKNMYVCFLANPQDDASVHELISDPQDSPFAQALSTAKWFVVIPTARVVIYERLWCVYEMFLALKRIHGDGELKVRMRWVKNKWEVAARAVLVLIFCVTPGALIGWFILAPKVGFLVGPLMWLMIFHLLGSIVWFIIHMIGDLCLQHEHPHDIPDCELKLMMAWTYARMVLAGLGGGLALYDLIHHHTNATLLNGAKEHEHLLELRWAPGEYQNCMIVFITFALMYCYDMLLTMIAEIVHREGGKLDRFETVNNAGCFSPEDAEQIWGEIGHEQKDIDEIDEAINDLRVLGKYDEGVLFNLRLGMGREVIRQGVNPFQIVCGVSAWTFWLSTDLAGRGYHWTPTAILLTLSLFGALLVYGPSSYSFGELVPDERFIFALTSSMWAGISYSVISNHPVFFHQEAALNHRMFVSTLPLFLVLLCLLACLNACYYCGCFASVKRALLGTTFHDHESVKQSYKVCGEHSESDGTDSSQG